MKKYDVVVCSIVKDEIDYLLEWIEHHLSIGVQHFYLIDNDSKIPVQDTILPYKKYINITHCKKIRNIQNRAYTQFVQYFKKFQISEWCAYIDIDEFITIKDNNISIDKFLIPYNDYAGLAINWTMFNANNHINKPKGKIKDNFTTINNDQRTIKTIANIDNIISFNHCHYPTPRHNKYCVDENFNRIDRHYNEKYLLTNKIKLHHYFTKSFEEWLDKLLKGSALNLANNKKVYDVDHFWKYNPSLLDKKEEILIMFKDKISKINKLYLN